MSFRLPLAGGAILMSAANTYDSAFMAACPAIPPACGGGVGSHRTDRRDRHHLRRVHPRAQESPMSHAPVAPMADETRYRVDICTSATLAHTHVTILGVLDVHAIDAIDAAIQAAEETQHTLTFELGEITLVTRDALTELLTHDALPYDGSGDFLLAAARAGTPS